MREKLIEAGVRNLKQFGYPGCNKDNILTDEIYKAFFISMLEGTQGPDAESLLNELKA